ncbi:MAG: hypothetical protein LBF74_05175 [Treponema sp.]|jgi:hypothetical protein|nr:hypothetical protein [Treponema sp.]
MMFNLNSRFHRSIAGEPAGVWLFLLLFSISQASIRAEPLVSPTWGFRIDLPEAYVYSGGDGRNRFSFITGEGAAVDLIVYPGGAYRSVQALAEDVQKRLGNRGDVSVFTYRGRQAAILELNFAQPDRGAQPYSGWGFCTELEKKDGGPPPFLAALAYGPADKADLGLLAVSALDSIAPAPSDERAPGPMTEFAFPRESSRRVTLANIQAWALFYEIDAEAAQALADREFEVLRRDAEGPKWREAWIRFYRMIYRDAWDRLADAAFALERSWHLGATGDETGNGQKTGAEAEYTAGRDRETAAKALAWVQSFAYERSFLGSDFVNPVSAALEGRGDCDSRAILWAIVLGHANIPAAIMVSREYSHAMGLADLDGPGARFEAEGKNWLVAETTAPVAPGLIAADNADPKKWIGVTF